MTEGRIKTLVTRGCHLARCQAKVRTGRMGDATLAFRRQKTAPHGLPIDACAAPANYEGDGVDLCDRHAGELALRILTEPAE